MFDVPKLPPTPIPVNQALIGPAIASTSSDIRGQDADPPIQEILVEGIIRRALLRMRAAMD